jgi:DNA polymerase-3 subunit gamma/tau
MEHRALALAYRPQTFGDVAGQRHVTDVLARAVEHDRVAHAYLFSGPRGTGKTTTARILAKVLNCPNRRGAEPCNTCDTCRDITGGVSLDVVEIDGASNRGIADIQQLREKVRFAATGGRWKVYIIDEVHQLSADAFAALLKTLEEPPPKVCFIFATTDPLKLPDTIRSRCQRYEFARVSVRAIADRLREIAAAETGAGRRLDLDEAAALLIARKAEGGLRDAVSALDQVVSSGRAKVDVAAVTEVLGLVSREAFFDLAQPLFGREPAQALAELHRAYRAGFDPKDLAEGLLEHLRNVLVLKVDPAARDLLAATPEECERYVAQGEGWSSADLLRMIKVVTEAIGFMRESSQPLLHFEGAVLELAHFEPGRTLAEVLAGLARLEGAGGGGAAGGGGGGIPPRPALRAMPAAPAAPAPPAAPPVRSIPGLDAVRAAPPPEAVRPPATAPARAPGSGGGDFDPAPAWPAVVEAVRTKNRVLAHFVGDARLLGADAEGLVLEVEAGGRTMLEHRDNRAILLGALAAAYGRRLDYRVVIAPGAPPASPPVPAPAARGESKAPGGGAPVETGPPPGFDDAEDPGPAASAAATEPAADPVAAPARTADPSPGGRRKQPGDLSPGARSAMVWLEGEIVGPPRPAST